MTTMDLQIVAVTPEPEWEPVLGEYGWLWILILGVAIFIGYTLVQQRREQEEERLRRERMWGQHEGESTEQWQARVKKQEEDIEKWKRERQMKALMRQSRNQNQKRRSRGSVYNERGEFDPPGGWGGMGPG
jgi:hypothetical protein